MSTKVCRSKHIYIRNQINKLFILTEYANPVSKRIVTLIKNRISLGYVPLGDRNTRGIIPSLFKVRQRQITLARIAKWNVTLDDGDDCTNVRIIDITTDVTFHWSYNASNYLLNQNKKNKDFLFSSRAITSKHL